MRTLTTALTTLILLLLGLSPAAALTDGPTCRAACAPRIADECPAPGVRGFKKCRRRIVRACKQSTPESVCPTTRPDERNDGGDGGGTGGGGPGGGTGGGSGVSPIADALADRFLRIGRSDFFSSGSITETQEMTLCASGRLTLVVTTITTTSIGDITNDFDSQETFDGTWSVRRVSGTDVLELATGEPEPRRFAVELASDGTILLDGTVAEIDDARGQCGTVGGGGGGGGGTEPQPDDPIAQATATLADRVLVLRESNIGFGTRTTVIVLCASGRYALELETSAAPGVVTSSIGAWAVEASGAELTLALRDDDGQTERSFTLATDADGNLLANGTAVAEGNPALVGDVCPQL